MLRSAWLAWLLKSGPATLPSATCPVWPERNRILEPVAIVEIAEPGIGASPSIGFLRLDAHAVLRLSPGWDLLTLFRSPSADRRTGSHSGADGGSGGARGGVRGCAHRSGCAGSRSCPAQIDDAW